MSISFSIAGTAPGRTRTDVLAVAVFADGDLGPGADAVDTAVGGTLVLHSATPEGWAADERFGRGEPAARVTR